MFISVRSFNHLFLHVSSLLSSFRTTRVSSFFNIGFTLSIVLVLQLLTGIIWYCFLHCSDSYWITIDCSLRSVFFSVVHSLSSLLMRWFFLFLCLLTHV